MLYLLEVEYDILAARMKQIVEECKAFENMSPVLAFIIQALIEHLLRDCRITLCQWVTFEVIPATMTSIENEVPGEDNVNLHTIISIKSCWLNVACASSFICVPEGPKGSLLVAARTFVCISEYPLVLRKTVHLHSAKHVLDSTCVLLDRHCQRWTVTDSPLRKRRNTYVLVLCGTIDGSACVGQRAQRFEGRHACCWLLYALLRQMCCRLVAG